MTTIRVVLATGLGALAVALGVAHPLAQPATGPALPRYPLASTALLVVDPYNDFLSEGGKACPATKETATSQGLVEHMTQALGAARAPHLRARAARDRAIRRGARRVEIAWRCRASELPGTLASLKEMVNR